jgi:hypothetical protein
MSATSGGRDFEMFVAWETARRGQEICASVYDAANRADDDAGLETALDQMDIGEAMLERGDALTAEISARAAAEGVIDDVLAIVEPLYRL